MFDFVCVLVRADALRLVGCLDTHIMSLSFKAAALPKIAWHIGKYGA